MKEHRSPDSPSSFRQGRPLLRARSRPPSVAFGMCRLPQRERPGQSSPGPRIPIRMVSGFGWPTRSRQPCWLNQGCRERNTGPIPRRTRSSGRCSGRSRSSWDPSSFMPFAVAPATFPWPRGLRARWFPAGRRTFPRTSRSCSSFGPSGSRAPAPLQVERRCGCIAGPFPSDGVDPSVRPSLAFFWHQCLTLFEDMNEPESSRRPSGKREARFSRRVHYDRSARPRVAAASYCAIRAGLHLM
jgi:hypothetical protein